MPATFYVLQKTKLDLKKTRERGYIELVDLVKHQILALPKAYAIDFFSLELDGEPSPIEDEDSLKEELQNILSELDKFDKLILNAAFITKRNYELISDNKTSFRYGPALADSPLHLATYLEEADDMVLATIEHSFLIENEEGGLGDNSLVYYYGYHNKKSYRGLVEEIETDKIEDFDLSPLNMTVFIDAFETTEESLQIIKDFVKNYGEYSINQEEGFSNSFRIEDNLVYYYLNGPELDNTEELNRFISLCSGLIKDLKPFRNQKGILAINPIFLDLASDLPKKVRIEFDDNGSHRLYVTSL